MPWTRKQVKFLLSKGSPLSGAQRTKMKGELHANPSMGHKSKGYMDPHHSHPFSLDPSKPRACLICGQTMSAHRIK